MAKGPRDPWLDFGDPVDDAELEAERIVAPDNGVAEPEAPDAFADIATEVIDTQETITGFADEMPDEVVTRLSPEDEQEYIRIASEAPIDEAAGLMRRFMASRGFDDENIDRIVQFRREHGTVGNSFDYQTAKPLEPIPDDGATGAFARGAGDTITVGALERLGAVVDALGATDGRQNLWNSDLDFADLYNRNLDINRGIIDRDEKDHAAARIGGQLLAGLVIPSGVKGVALKAGTDALRAGKSMTEARSITAVAARNRLTAEGAGFGGAHGFNAGEGDIGDRLVNSATEAGLGVAAGAVAGKAGEIIAPSVRARAVAARNAPLTENQEFAAAAANQGLDYMAADLPQAPFAKAAIGLNNVTAGGIPLAEQGAKNVAKAGARRDEVAEAIGAVADETGAGQAAQRGARQFIEETDAKTTELYEAVPIPKDADAVLSNTRGKLADLTGGFQSNAKLASEFENPKLVKYLDALKTGKLSWNDLKDFRTRIGKIIGKPSLTSDGQQDDELRALYGALSEDMRATASAHGSAASKAFERANTYARARANRIDNVVSGILGKKDDKGAQSAFEAIERLARARGGDPIKLAQTLRSMPDDEANSVRATMLSRLGQASKGRQNDKGEVFSADQFVTEWNGLSERGKAILFTGEHRKAVDELAKVFSGMKASSKWENTSKSGISVVASTHTLPTMFSNPVLGGLSLAIQYGGGKLLASPRYAKWLSGLAKKPNKGARLAHVQRLGGIAKAEPAIASDVLALQQRLTEAFAQQPMKAAASDSSDRSEKP